MFANLVYAFLMKGRDQEGRDELDRLLVIDPDEERAALARLTGRRAREVS